MKTSVIEVHDMLSVWNVDEAEKRIGEVPGVESVTVNFAAGSATLRYDETRLKAADIKSAVRQRGYEATTSGSASAGDAHEGHAASGAPPGAAAPPAPNPSPAAPASTPAPMAAASKSAPDAATATPAAAAGDRQPGKTNEPTTSK